MSINEKKVNPWAVCHASTGPKKSNKFERCVKSVKSKQGIEEMNIENPINLSLEESLLKKIISKFKGGSGYKTPAKVMKKLTTGGNKDSRGATHNPKTRDVTFAGGEKKTVKKGAYAGERTRKYLDAANLATAYKRKNLGMKVQKKSQLECLELMADKIVESIKLLPYVNLAEELIEEGIKYTLAQKKSSLDELKEEINLNEEKIDEIAPLLMLGARLAAPYVMRAVASRGVGALAGRAAGAIGNRIMQRGGQATLQRVLGKRGADLTSKYGGRYLKGEVKDAAGNLVPEVGGPKLNFDDEENKNKKKKNGDTLATPKADQLYEPKSDPLDEGFSDWLRSKAKKTWNKFTTAAKDPMTYVRGAGKLAKFAGKTALNVAAAYMGNVPFVGGALKLAQAGVQKGEDAAAKAKKDMEDRKEDIAARKADPRRRAALRAAEKERDEAKQNQQRYSQGSNPFRNSTELFGNKIVERFSVLLNELSVETLKSYRAKAMAQDPTTTPMKREKGISKASGKIARNASGRNTRKSVTGSKSKGNEAYIKRGKAGPSKPPMSKKQIDGARGTGREGGTADAHQAAFDRLVTGLSQGKGRKKR